MAEKKKAPVKQHHLLSILDKQPEAPKATIKALKRIDAEFGGLANVMTKDGVDSDIDYGKIAKLFWIMVDEVEEKEVSLEEVEEKLNMHNLRDAMQAINEWMSVPEDAIAAVEGVAGEDAVSTESAKN